MTGLDRFTKFTNGQEPALTRSIIAALILGAIVTFGEKFGIVFDEFTLTLLGVVAVVATGWLIRQGVWSPASHEAEVETALKSLSPADAKAAE